MKFNRKLIAISNGVRVDLPLVSLTLTQGINESAKAVFEIPAGVKTHSANQIEYAHGYGQSLDTVFCGYIKTFQRLSNGNLRILAVSYSEALQQEIAVSMRNVKVAKILKTISEKTGVKIQYHSDFPHAKNVPFFFHKGSAFSAIQQLFIFCGLIDAVILTERDGSAWVGKIQHHPRNNIVFKIDAKILQNSNVNSSEIVQVPKMAPGLNIQVDAQSARCVERVTETLDNMQIYFEQD